MTNENPILGGYGNHCFAVQADAYTENISFPYSPSDLDPSGPRISLNHPQTAGIRKRVPFGTSPDGRLAVALLDQAVRDAYGMKKSDDQLAFLLNLNQTVANKEDAGEPVVGPGLPPVVKDKSKLVTDDCIRMPGDVSCDADA